MYYVALFMSNGKNKKVSGAEPKAGWTFLTNHSHVLICLSEDSGLRVRDIAGKVAITERAVLKILRELEEGGVISREREGRRTRYEIHAAKPLRHPVEANCKVSHLLGMMGLGMKCDQKGRIRNLHPLRAVDSQKREPVRKGSGSHFAQQ
jgi:DNA-binding transcriptional ArsR family regulator